MSGYDLTNSQEFNFVGTGVTCMVQDQPGMTLLVYIDSMLVDRYDKRLRVEKIVGGAYRISVEGMPHGQHLLSIVQVPTHLMDVRVGVETIGDFEDALRYATKADPTPKPNTFLKDLKDL